MHTFDPTAGMKASSPVVYAVFDKRRAAPTTSVAGAYEWRGNDENIIGDLKKEAWVDRKVHYGIRMETR